MTINFTPKGVCSRGMQVEVENGIVVDAKIIGGCSGNTQGVCALVKGMSVEEAIKRMEGIKCGPKPTSCPDQLAQAIKACVNSK